MGFGCHIAELLSGNFGNREGCIEYELNDEMKLHSIPDIMASIFICGIGFPLSLGLFMIFFNFEIWKIV